MGDTRLPGLPTSGGEAGQLPRLPGALVNRALRRTTRTGALPRLTTARPATSGAAVSDNFNRVNETPLGTSSSGHAWGAHVGGGLSVVSNQCKGTTAVQRISTIDTGSATGSVSVDFVTSTQTHGQAVVARYTDTSNYLRLTAAGALIEKVAGVDSTKGNLSGGPVNDGDRITVSLSATRVTVLRNGVGELNPLMASTPGTRHGLLAADTTAFFDNFEVAST